MFLIGISFAWIAGIWLGSLFDVPPSLVLCAILPVPLIFIFRKLRKRLILLTLSLLFLFTGTWLSPILSHQSNFIATYNDRGSVEFKGMVCEPAEKLDNRSRVLISIMEADGRPCGGKVLYSTYANPILKYGDVIQGKGLFQSPPSFGDFDYRSYLAGEGINSTTQQLDYRIIEFGSGSPAAAWIFDLRKQLADSLASALPEPQSSLCQGIVLGIRNNISPDLKNDLSVTGSAHLLAISGLNLTIIAGLLLSLGLLTFGRRYYIYAWLTLSIIWFYSLLTGLQAPVIRSAIMASVFLLAEILGRQKRAFPALIFSAAIMTGFSPYVLGNISFQLSFLAMVGLIFITPFIKKLGTRAVCAAAGEEGFWSKLLSIVMDSFSVSMGAVMVVWPIIAWHFQIISFVGPLTTFLISPVLTPIIIFGSLTAFAGLLSAVIAQIIGYVTWLFLSYMIVLAWAFAVLPLAYIRTSTFNSFIIWPYYALLLLLINGKTVFSKIEKHRLKEALAHSKDWSVSSGEMIGRKAKWIMTPLLIIAFLTSLAAVTMPERDIKVSFLNVGEGESILIQTEGQNILIDGGPSSQAVELELGKLLPFWERKIDLVILTHPHLDHLTGLLEVLKRYQVKKVLASPVPSDLPSYQEWLQLINSRNIEYKTAQSGQQIILSNGAILDILNPPGNVMADAAPDPDQNAIVARLSCGIHSILFTSDIGSETETRLLRERLVKDSDVLEIGHHGSNNSTSTMFLNSIDPYIAVISAGADNQFGHPAKATLERITESGINSIYRTDLNGTITLQIDMKNPGIRVKTER